jgi:hypothetical protein
MAQGSFIPTGERRARGGGVPLVAEPGDETSRGLPGVATRLEDQCKGVWTLKVRSESAQSPKPISALNRTKPSRTNYVAN